MAKGIITATMQVDAARKQARFSRVLALGEQVDIAIEGITGTDAAGLRLTLRSYADTPGLLVAACAEWRDEGGLMLGTLDLATKEMVAAFEWGVRERVFIYALSNHEDGELLAAGQLTIRGNPDCQTQPGESVTTGYARDFVTGGDSHAHDGDPTSRISHHHLLDKGTLTHKQLEEGLADATNAATVATHSAQQATSRSQSAEQTANDAADLAHSADALAEQAAQAAASALEVAGEASGAVQSGLAQLAALDGQNTQQHATLSERIGVLEGTVSPETSDYIRQLLAAVEVLQSRCAALEWLAGRVPDAEGQQWARIYGVESVEGRVALGPLGEFEAPPTIPGE